MRKSVYEGSFWMRSHSCESWIWSARRRASILSTRAFSRERIVKLRKPSLANRMTAPTAMPTRSKRRCLLMDRPYAKNLHAEIRRFFPQCFFDAEELVVLADALRAARRARLNLAGIER